MTRLVRVFRDYKAVLVCERCFREMGRTRQEFEALYRAEGVLGECQRCGVPEGPVQTFEDRYGWFLDRPAWVARRR